MELIFTYTHINFLIISFSSLHLRPQDIKRGFCFVFFKDAPNMEEKRRTEDFVDEINGMYVYNKHHYSFSFLLPAQSSLSSSSSSLSPISTVPCH